jgi:Ricin-type beta-trefoil lectin domain
MRASESIRRLVRPVADRVPTGGRLTLAALCLGVALACTAVVGAVSFLPAAAGNAIEGQPVDAATTQTLMVAALSCPVLTGPRLAGTMMAASGMDFNATGGVAGLTASTFTKWAPWPAARAADPDANTYALAHYLCSLSGQVRDAGVGGDRWDGTVAAYYAGVAAVVAASGVPSDARKFVDTVNGYAAWYAEQPGFADAPGGTPEASTNSDAVTAHVAANRSTSAVPDEYVAAIVSAGHECAALTPPMVAAQLAAASGFDPNLRAATQAMGIAQVLPNMWMEYAPSVSSSPWEPATAISVLGSAVCDLIHQFASVGDAKPYEMALAAFRVGTTAVRQAGGIPPIAAVRQFIAQVESDTSVYEQDARLTGTGTSAGPSAGAGPSAPAPSPAAAGSPSPSAPNPPAAPPSPGPQPPDAGSAAPPTGPITGLLGLCVDIPGANPADGTQLQVWGCNGTPAQQWTIEPDGTIQALGKCIDVDSARADNNTKVQLWTCNGVPHQKWVHRADGSLYSPVTGSCLDAFSINYGWGSLLATWACNGQSNQTWTLPKS